MLVALKFSLDFLKKLSKREKTVLVGTATVIALAFSDRLILRPIFTTFRSMEQESKDLQVSIKKSMRLLSQKEDIKRLAEEYATYSVQAKSADEEIVALLKKVEGIAGKSSVNLLYVKPAGTANEGNAKKYFASLECEGQMQQLIIFFHAIENSEELLRIEKYEIEAASEESSVAKAAIRISKTVVP